MLKLDHMSMYLVKTISQVESVDNTARPSSYLPLMGGACLLCASDAMVLWHVL